MQECHAEAAFPITSPGGTTLRRQVRYFGFSFLSIRTEVVHPADAPWLNLTVQGDFVFCAHGTLGGGGNVGVLHPLR
jgi:hypothetical protein